MLDEIIEDSSLGLIRPLDLGTRKMDENSKDPDLGFSYDVGIKHGLNC